MESEIQQAGFRLHRINAIRGESTACKNWVAKRDSQFKLLGRRLNLKEERKLLTELIQNFPELPDVRYIPDIERDPQALGYRRRQVCHLLPVNHQLARARKALPPTTTPALPGAPPAQERGRSECGEKPSLNFDQRLRLGRENRDAHRDLPKPACVRRTH